MTEVADAVALMETRPDVRASVASKMNQVSTSPIVWWTEEDDLQILKVSDPRSTRTSCRSMSHTRSHFLPFTLFFLGCPCAWVRPVRGHL